MRQIPDDNLKYPVLVRTLIKNDKGEDITHLMGSGVFFLSDKSFYFATAKHVLYNEKGLLNYSIISLTYYGKNTDLANEMELNLLNLEKEHLILVHKSADVVIIKIGKDEKAPQSKEGHMDFSSTAIQMKIENGSMVCVVGTKQFKEVMIANDIFLLGYPSSLKSNGEIDVLRPLLRKGIVAGKNKLKKTIIIDSPVYQGNSGGPVFEKENTDSGFEIRLIGLVTQMVPFLEITETTSLHYQYKYKNISWENSGYAVVVPVDFIFELIKEDQN
ncbi:MAG: trypsin-like peptidase domain-containing protein [Minisyncoccia bacterium]